VNLDDAVWAKELEGRAAPAPEEPADRRTSEGCCAPSFWDVRVRRELQVERTN
jgi:hypothetical protein